jgi:hypothetical protein
MNLSKCGILFMYLETVFTLVKDMDAAFPLDFSKRHKVIATEPIISR